jgi:hypothetical protein
VAHCFLEGFATDRDGLSPLLLVSCRLDLLNESVEALSWLVLGWPLLARRSLVLLDGCEPSWEEDGGSSSLPERDSPRRGHLAFMFQLVISPQAHPGKMEA